MADKKITALTVMNGSEVSSTDILHVVRKGIVEWSVKTVLNHMTH